RIAALRGAALQYILHVDVRPLEPDTAEELVEGLYGLPCERYPRLGLVHAGPFTDEQADVVRGPDAEADMPAPVRERSPPAAGRPPVRSDHVPRTARARPRPSSARCCGRARRCCRARGPSSGSREGCA